jgi:hypothetical protein
VLIAVVLILVVGRPLRRRSLPWHHRGA